MNIPWADVRIGDELEYMTFDSPWGMALVRRIVTAIDGPTATLVSATPDEGVWSDEGVYHVDTTRATGPIRRLAPSDDREALLDTIEQQCLNAVLAGGQTWARFKADAEQQTGLTWPQIKALLDERHASQ